MTDDIITADLTPEEAWLSGAFAELVAPPGARRWDPAPGQPAPPHLRRLVRRSARAGARRQWAPLLAAGIVAAATGGAGLALGLHSRQPGNGAVVPGAQQSASPVPTSQPSPGASPPPPTSSPTAQATPGAGGFTCTAQFGGTPGIPAQLTAVRVAHQTGFDRVTFEFTPPPPGTPLGDRVGIPEYAVTPQGSPAFARDASGAVVILDGVSGLKVVFRDTSAVGLDGSPTYSGSSDLRPALPAVREVVELGDVERVLTWGVGLSSAQCFHVTELTGPLRIVIDVASGS